MNILTKKQKKALAVRAARKALEQLPAESKKLRVAAALLEPQNLKRLGVAAAGSAAVLGLTASAIRTRLYRRALARELKRQLAPINKKLDALEKQNKELMEQNEQLKKQLHLFNDQKNEIGDTLLSAKSIAQQLIHEAEREAAARRGGLLKRGLDRIFGKEDR